MTDIAKLRRRAETGNIVAICTLGIYYLNGFGVPTDLVEAFRLLTIASRRGASRATLNLATMYEGGLGVPANVHEAVRLYELAAAHGEFMAKLALGRIYSRGERLPVDLALASKWYSAALSGGEAVVETKELSEAREFLLSHPDT